jgi:peptide-methionine (R)-S-oxide reductase
VRDDDTVRRRSRRGGDEGYEVALTDEAWRARLGPDRYAVLRRAATEPAFSGSLLEEHRDGSFRCGGCGQVLFTSDAKFDSGTGWPSFDRAIPGTVAERRDDGLLLHRTEIVCTRCGGHLGHVFDDGPTPTGRRYCVNSLAIEFDEADEQPS